MSICLFKIETFNATGESRDERSAGIESQEVTLNVGENEFKIVGTAENGTKEEYTIIVVRMPKVGETKPQPTETITPTQEATSEEEPSEESSEQEEFSEDSGKDSKGGIPWWGVLLIAAAAVGGGFLLGRRQPGGRF